MITRYGVSREQISLKLLSHALKTLERYHDKSLTRKDIFPVDIVDPRKHEKIHQRILTCLREHAVISRLRTGAEVLYKVENEKALQTLLLDTEAQYSLLWPHRGSKPLSESLRNTSIAEEETTEPLTQYKVSSDHPLAPPEEDVQGTKDLVEEALVLTGINAKNLAYIRERLVEMDAKIMKVSHIVEEILKEWRNGNSGPSS